MLIEAIAVRYGAAHIQFYGSPVRLIRLSRTATVAAAVALSCIFGPAAFVGYRILARSGPERSMRAWRKAAETERSAPRVRSAPQAATG